MKFFTKFLTRRLVFFSLLFFAESYSASAQWIDLNLNQADSRFEFSGKRYWSKLGGSEEYRFYVRNLTNDTYRLVVRVNLDLACVGQKSFLLGVNKVVYMKGGESFDAFKDDWVHIYTSGADNFKSCRLTDGDTYTLLKGVRYTIEKIENVTQMEAAAANKKKKDDDAKQKIIDDKKKADADAKKKEDDTKKADDAKKKDAEGKSASKDTKNEKEDENTKKDSGNESARSAPVDNGPTKEEQEEIARQKAIKDEEDRKKRVQEWRDKKNQETSDNEDMATNFLIQAALAYYGIGNLIYSGFEPLGVLEEYTGMSSRLRMHLGYEISGTPMYTNSIIEDYNGNSTTFERKSEDHDSYNFNLGAGMEYWPLYHKNFGFGMHGGGSLGHGFTFEDFSLTYQYGLKTHWHPGKLGMVAEYTQGGREIDHSPWIESTESGGGNIAYTYERIGVGPSIRFDTDWDGVSESRFDLMAIFERPSFSSPAIAAGSTLDPAVSTWQNGFRANLSYSNRLDFFLEYFPSYQRDGVRDFGLALSSSSFAGSMFRFGIHRNFDFFGEGGNNSADSKHRTNREMSNRSILYIVSPGLSWMQNTPGKRFGNYYRFNIAPIAFEQEIDLTRNVALYAGVGVNVLEGGELEGYSNSPFGAGNKVNIEYVNVSIPVGLRFRSSLTESHFWWIKAGLGNMLPVYQALYLDGSSEAAEEDEIMARANGEMLPGYFNSTQISVGADFATGSNIMRCGIEYSVTNQDLLHSLGIGKMQGVRFLIGLTL